MSCWWLDGCRIIWRCASDSFQLYLLLVAVLQKKKKKIRFAYYWGTPLVNMSEVVGNHLENLLEGLESVGNPLANF
jgi:hypothetical protein